ncbi:OmpP1/FadL family transporter [Bacteroides sp. 224]|uniref:OmpP1/FadL family transporter n=1 Tax=Bacteroides sp. 224 TaxID=2302936 RepID=UPI0013D4C643|nr:outer membrane protein transport protein [Bacteroides sp. 224]NDV65876.1 TonB-dependent receptor [Bacteroides sp. 224]
MKKIITLTAFATLISIGMYAQTMYDATKIASRDLTGTARFVGMGGAMGALGGDISTMGVNPAGIGIYRSNDVAMTMSYGINSVNSKYQGTSSENEKNRFSFDNIGFVFSSPIGDYTSLRYVNFGFNYQRSKSFYKNMSMNGVMNMAGLSQTWQIANQAYGASPDKLGESYSFENSSLGWLSILGWEGFMLNGGFLNNDDEYEYASPLPQNELGAMVFDSKESGGIDKYDFNLSFNFNDRFYLGFTIGAYDVDYKKHSWYEEIYTPKTGYDLNSWNRIDGSGFDVKLGMIVRPFETSPLRIGFAVHTPTFYKLTYTTSAQIASNMYAKLDNEGLIEEVSPYKEGDFDSYEEGFLNSYDDLGADMKYDFKLNTPWVINASLGYTIGKGLALGAEYEYEDYSTMKYKDADGYKMDYEVDATKAMAKAVHTFRLGAEYKLVPQFALRAGYNYSTTAFDKKAWKSLPQNSIHTDTDYANVNSISNYTFGFGYRGENFYMDMAYKYNHYNEDFYAFHDNDRLGVDDRNFLNPINQNQLAATKVKNNRHQLMLTLGIRF